MTEAIDRSHYGLDPYDHIAAAHSRLKSRDSIDSSQTGRIPTTGTTGIESSSGPGSGSGSGSGSAGSGSSSASTDSTSSATTIGFTDIHHTGTATATTILQAKARPSSPHVLSRNNNSSSSTINTTITVTGEGINRSGGNTPTSIHASKISGPIYPDHGNIDINKRPRRAPPPPLTSTNSPQQLHRHHSTLGFSPTNPPQSFRNSLSLKYEELNGSPRPSAFEARRRSAYINIHPPPPPQPNNNPTMHLKNKPSDMTISSHGSSSSATNGTSTHKKRASKITSWMRRSNTNHHDTRPKISEPVLEYSTTDLLPEYQFLDIADAEKQRILLQRRSQLNLGTNTSLLSQRRQSEEFYRRLSKAPLSPLVDVPTASSLEHLEPVDTLSSFGSLGTSLISINSRNSPAIQLSAQLDAKISPISPSPPQQNRPSVPSVPSTPVTPITTESDEVKELRLKLKESDERRRVIMVEYQQKLDSERKRSLELQKRIEQLKAEKYLQPPTDPKSRIKMVETQRDALRTALNQLREAKDIEITEYRSRLDRFSRPISSNSFASSQEVLPARTLSSDLSPPAKQLPPVLRCGISPLLPIGRPVYFEGKIKN